MRVPCRPLLLVCLILFQLSGTSVGQTLKERLKPIIDAHAGEVTVAIKNLTTGEAYEHEATKVMPTASLIKFPILVELYRQMEEGILPTSRMVTLTQEEMVPGSGILTQHFPAGTTIPIEGVARLMITYSDNTATNMIWNR